MINLDIVRDMIAETIEGRDPLTLLLDDIARRGDVDISTDDTDDF